MPDNITSLVDSVLLFSFFLLGFEIVFQDMPDNITSSVDSVLLFSFFLSLFRECLGKFHCISLNYFFCTRTKASWTAGVFLWIMPLF